MLIGNPKIIPEVLLKSESMEINAVQHFSLANSHHGIQSVKQPCSSQIW